MKLLVISHPCVVPTNQEVFTRIAVKRGWSITIVVPSRWKSEYGPRRSMPSPSFRGHLRRIPVIMSGSVPLHAYLRNLKGVIAEERPQVIYIHNEPYAAATFQWFRAARHSDVPIAFYSAQNLLKRYPWPFSTMENYVFSRAHFAHAVSSSVAEVLRLKGYPGRTAVIPLPVDTHRYRLPVEAMHRSRTPLTVGYVGRVADEKGLQTLLLALSAFPPQAIRAVVAGNGPAMPAMRKLATRLGLDERVSWRGYVPHEDMPGVYAQLDLLAVPSVGVANWREQFGRVVVEAMACGVPVVASDSGELPQLISWTHGGWTFPERDHQALTSVITQVLNNPKEARERGASGRQAVIERFDTEVVAEYLAAQIGEAAARC